MPHFDHYLALDYSGASTADASLPGLRLYQASIGHAPREVPPPPGRRRYWSRRGLAEWLTGHLGASGPTLVGVDHGLSFPRAYFEAHALAPDWSGFLDDFHRHWPTDEADTPVDFVRDGLAGRGAARAGRSTWRRLTEVRAGSAKSVFHFDVPGSVAKSTHAGLPWIRHLRRRLAGRLHVWPFDGWLPPPGRSVLAEVYPALVSGSFPRQARTPDQHDAYSVAAWMRRADAAGELAACLTPALTAEERALADCEGWILGVR